MCGSRYAIFNLAELFIAELLDASAAFTMQKSMMPPSFREGANRVQAITRMSMDQPRVGQCRQHPVDGDRVDRASPRCDLLLQGAGREGVLLSLQRVQHHAAGLCVAKTPCFQDGDG